MTYHEQSVQTKNFAVQLKDASQALGKSVAELNACAPQPLVNDILQTIERLYFQSDRLERSAHNAILKIEHCRVSSVH